MDATERFWSKVSKDGPVPEHRPDLGPCWLWTAGLFSEGYGQFWFDGKPRKAHRWAWEQEHGPMPDGLVPDHLCRRRECVRPSHQEPVTEMENLRRGEGLPARNARKEQCDHGHPLTGDNLLELSGKNGRTWRVCRECKRRTDRESKRRRRAAAGQ